MRAALDLVGGGPFAYLEGMVALLPIFAGRHRQLLQFDGASLNPLQVAAPDLIRWIDAKEPRAIGSWRDLGTDEYARAFTAAGTTGLNIVDDLYFAFADTIASGGTEKDFARLVVPTLQAKGWLATPGDGEGQAAKRIATRVNLIYDTNLRMARGAGQWDRVQRSKAGLPYLRGGTAQDDRVRHPPHSANSDHRAFQGIVLPVDHPFWTRWWTPLGFRCRCTIIPMVRSAAMRLGITSEDDLAEREARLGTPVFRAPGASVTQQLAEVISVSNTAEHMLGLPALNLPEVRAEADRAWRTDTAHAEIDSLLDRLFG